MTTTSKQRVTVGTRTSPLSLAQTDEVLRKLRKHFPDIEFIALPMSTVGDRHKKAPLLSMERGMFVKEIERALLDSDIDMAVHSAKDLPAILPDGLVLAAFTEREDPRDVLVSKSGLTLNGLKHGAVLGTSSPRRQALIKAHFPNISVLPVRGNVGTRMQRAKSPEYDGVILAAAGIKRLNRQDEIAEYFDPDWFVPDTGQGALAVEARESDSEILEMLAKINHEPTSIAVRIERAFLKTMSGGCRVPTAAYARFHDSQLRVVAMAAVPDGSEIFRDEMATNEIHDPEGIGQRLAESLLAKGAARILPQSDAV